MTIDPRTATLDAIRDWFAERDGWNRPGTYPEPTGDPMIDAFDNTIVRARWWRRDKTGKYQTQYDHPYPPTRDGAASAMPEGWGWTLAYHYDGVKRWVAQDKNCRNTQMMANTGDEIHDRYALALAAMKAERGQA